MDKKFFDSMEQDILNSNIPDSEKNKLLKNCFHLKEQKLNPMILGATGCGKSSTINALFNTEVAKVGVGVDPETMEITKYELENLILWDSPDHWNSEANAPDFQLQTFLDEQVHSIQKRIKEATGVSIHTPISYSARCGYNVEKLFDLIVDHIPLQRRVLLK